MKTRFRMVFKNKNGFTLIELLAVILILGIIALIAIPSINGIIKQAKKSSSEASGNQIIESFDSYYAYCKLNYGKDKNGNDCFEDLKDTNLTSEELSQILGVVGEFPEIEDFIVFKKNETGGLALIYRKDSLACSNQVDEEGNISYKYTGIINKSGVKCEEKKISSSGSVLLDTNGDKNVLKSYYNATTKSGVYTEFKSNTYRNTIYEIKFVNYIIIPTTVPNEKKWDVSEKKDGSIMAWLEPIEEGSTWNTLYIGSLGDIYANPHSEFLFAYFSNVVSISFGNFHTDDVVNMGWMFLYDDNLAEMDISDFNTSKVTDMELMFFSNSSLKSLDLSNWDVSNVTNMNFMFYNTSSLENIYLSRWNTVKVKTMQSMFERNELLKHLNISNWDVSNLEKMISMFQYMTSLEVLDISGWKTSSLKDITAAFSATGLKTIYAGSGWDISGLDNTNRVFVESFNLKGAVAYDANKIGTEMANYTTGYFTYKAS